MKATTEQNIRVENVLEKTRINIKNNEDEKFSLDIYESYKKYRGINVFSVNRLEINDTLGNKESVVYCLLIYNVQRYFSQHESSIKWNYFVNAIFAREIVF